MPNAATVASPESTTLTTQAIADAVRALTPYMVKTLSDFVAA